MSFETALPIVLRHEGGYVNHPSDRGGPTKQGITQGVYDTYRMTSATPTQSVRDISGSEVAEIYRNKYWRMAKCDKLPDGLALCVFDAAVNHGHKRAIVLLQRAVDANDDGIFGPKTMAAVTSEIGIVGEASVIAKYLSERESFYDAIVDRDPSQAVFLRGWKNRIALLRSELGLT